MALAPLRKNLSTSLLLLAAVALLQGCGKNEEAKNAGGPPKRPPVPVVTAKARITDFPVEMAQMGTVEPLQTTPVKAQIGGSLVGVKIADGQNVQAGQLLFEIDPKPLEGTIRQLEADRDRWDAQIKAAEAQARALDQQGSTAAAQASAAEAITRAQESQAALAEAQEKRYAALVEKEYVTREQFEQMRTAAQASKATLASSRSQAEAAKSVTETAKTNAEAARATIESARASRAATIAALENAKVQLGYASIHSPISGQAGNVLVEKGDFVKGNGDTTLVVINRINPIQIRFSLPEPLLPELMRYRKEGTLKVVADVPGGSQREGKLTFVDNTVDRNTGTITVRAEFDNPDSGLWPGQFVNVKLRLYTRSNAVLVPSAAVQVGQKGPYVYVIGKDQTANLRPVKPGLAGNGMTVIEEGLSADETVVVDGHLKITQGAATVEKPAPGSPQAAAQARPAAPKAAEGAGK